MSIRKIGGVWFWTFGALGGSVYLRTGEQRKEFFLDLTAATIVGVGIGLLVGFGI